MSPLEQFFTFGFISIFSVAILATWFCYLSSLIRVYRTVLRKKQQHSEKYLSDNLNF